MRRHGSHRSGDPRLEAAAKAADEEMAAEAAAKAKRGPGGGSDAPATDSATSDAALATPPEEAVAATAEAEGADASGGEPAPILDLGDAKAASNDEWAYRQADKLVRRLPGRTGGQDRRTEGEVFDHQALMTLHRLLTHGVLRSLDFPVSTGKEANVFRGTSPRGGYVAVKIYRINTATFKHVLQYIQGDERFEGVTGDKRGLVLAWCQKEYRNLLRLREAGVAVPEPIKAVGNILVTEYIGVKAGPYPTLKEAGRLADPEALWKQVADDYVRSYNVAGLVHADLSEYNIMLENAGQDPSVQRARIMDVGQAVLWNHPMATEFLERDLKNVTNYFRRQGADARPEQIRLRLKAPDPGVRRDMARAERAAASAAWNEEE